MQVVNTKAQFIQAYSRETDAILRYFLFRVREREVAKDLTQETFIRVWAYLAKGKEITYFKSFCYTTAHHILVNYYKKKKAASLDALLESGMAFEDTSALSSTSIEWSMTLLHEIERLGDKYQEIVRLRYIDGLGVTEIARSLGLTENVVSVRLHRGIKQLRITLTDI